jgi:hypothetical protein
MRSAAHWNQCAEPQWLYRLARLGALHRRIQGTKLDKPDTFLHRFGRLSLSLAALLPLPFPTSGLRYRCGVQLGYRFVALVRSFGLGRICCFAVLAYVFSAFGRRVAAGIWSAHATALVPAAGGLLVCIALLM